MGRYINDRNSNRRVEKPKMHKAVCDKCNKECEVPFRPSGNKPIFCSRCFENEPGGKEKSRDRGNRREKPEMFPAICDKCKKNCEVPFRPSPDKPIYCSDCFEKVDSKRGEKQTTSSIDITPLKEELSNISLKLDKLIELLTPVKKEKAVAKAKPKAKKAAKK
jgi:CxxC-x17-CxxC domain-containing protein